MNSKQRTEQRRANMHKCREIQLQKILALEEACREAERQYLEKQRQSVPKTCEPTVDSQPLGADK